MKLTDSDVKTIEAAETIQGNLRPIINGHNRTPDVSMHWEETDPCTGRPTCGSWELLERIDAALRRRESWASTSEPLTPVLNTPWDPGETPLTPEAELFAVASHYQAKYSKPRELTAAGVEAVFQELMAPYYREASKLLVKHAHDSAVGYA